MYGSGEVGFVDIFIAALLNDYVRGNQFGEIVHNEPGEDFLKDVLHLFCMKVQKAHGVFEGTEGSFNAPAHSIEVFQYRGRKSVRV